MEGKIIDNDDIGDIRASLLSEEYKTYILRNKKVKNTFGIHSDHFTNRYIQDLNKSVLDELKNHVKYIRIFCKEDRLQSDRPFIIRCTNIKTTDTPLEQLEEITRLIGIAKAELKYNGIVLLLVEIRYSTRTYFSFYKLK